MINENKIRKKDLKQDFQKLLSKIDSMILTGVFKPRERLVEANLARMLNVSRFWIRDAFKILETKGLVKVIPYKGAVVKDLSEQEIEDIFVLRVTLEKLATRLALNNIKDLDIKVLKRMAKLVEESFHHQNTQEMINANTNFHDYIFELSRNLVLKNMINDLRGRCHIVRYSAWSSPENVQRILKEHKLFIKAFEAKDIEKLDELSEQHITHSKISYLLQLKLRKSLSNNL